MPDVEPLAIAVATVAAFVLSGTYYAVLGDQLATVSPAAAAAAGHQPTPLVVLAELARSLVVVTVVAGLAAEADIVSWLGGAGLGVALWVGFPLVLWLGAILHERTAPKLAAIHAGDWLLNLPVVAVIVSAWP